MAFPVLKRAEAGNSDIQLGDICFQVLVELYSVTAFNLYERTITSHFITKVFVLKQN